jgi:hypothetical protein
MVDMQVLALAKADHRGDSVSSIHRIAKIDRALDRIRRDIRHRVGGEGQLLDAFAWQGAWDRNPDLKRLDDALMTARGLTQVQRDTAINREYAAEQRRKPKAKPVPLRKCPTCGSPTAIFANAEA